MARARRGAIGYLRLFGSGVAMGAADLVPGVSGGTMAFITGIYEELIAAIRAASGHHLMLVYRGEFREFFYRVPTAFIAVLLSGVAFSLFTFSQAVRFLLNDETCRPLLFAVFVGLILGSVYFCARRVEKWNWQAVAALFLGILLAFWITSFPARNGFASGTLQVPLLPKKTVANAQGVNLVNYDADAHAILDVDARTLSTMLARRLVDPKALVEDTRTGKVATAESFVSKGHSFWLDGSLVACGAMAASAMLLPGISGSYLLAVFGVYNVFIGALADFAYSLRYLAIDWDAFAILASGALGLLGGLALFSRVVAWLLAHYHAVTIAMLTGFMLGALRAVWPFWRYAYMVDPLRPHRGAVLHPLSVYFPDPSNSVLWLSLGVGVLACALVMTLEWFAFRPSEA